MRTRTRILALTSAGALALAGCGSEDTSTAADAAGPLQVVASTNVWASVAEAVAGDAAEVTGIIADPVADPHSYESTPADAAAVTDADLVVHNGGGYDEFMTDILSSGGDTPAVNAFEFSGHGAEDGEERTDEEGEEEHGEVNEHVWYDLPTVAAVAQEIAVELGGVDPANAATFTANAESFTSEINDLTARTAALATGAADVVATEPVADYLVEAAGLTLVSPAEFVEAIEEESDPSAGAVAEMNDLLGGGTVGLLVFNTQTVGPVTADVRETAEAAGIPVVEVTETLPEGADGTTVGYVEWMGAQVSALEAALADQA